MDVNTMAHRWCNCDFGKNGNGFNNRGAHVSCDDYHFYSYSTVYAMWLDKTEEKKLMVVMDDACSVTSNKHLSAILSAVPKGVKVISTHLNGGWCYNNVEFSKTNWMNQLPEALLTQIDCNVHLFKSSSSATTRSVLDGIQSKVNDLNWLFDNRKECKPSEFIHYLCRKPELIKLFRLIRKKYEPVKLVDGMLGKGEYDKYLERIRPQLKAERTRKFVAWFNNTHYGYGEPFNKKEIDKMPISKKVKYACHPRAEKWEIQNESYHFRVSRNRRLAKYVVGESEADVLGSHYSGIMFEANAVRNRFTGERYEFPDVSTRMFVGRTDSNAYFFIALLKREWCENPYLVYNDFKQSKDKNNWLRRFYQKCRILSERRKALSIWCDVQIYGDSRIDTLDEAGLAMYNRIQLKYVKYLEVEEMRKCADEAERKYLEAERIRKEEERKLKYNDYVARGIDGYRDLYYEKLDNISNASRNFGDEFFFGGNVLLRWRTDSVIETSKSIFLTIPQAKNIYKKVLEWHNNPSKYEPSRFETKSGNYNTQSYKNDILTAGCHQVAWCEMDRMYNEILKREAV